MSDTRQESEHFKPIWIVIFFVFSLCLTCRSEIQVYRYVDDTENLISNDDYYAEHHPSSVYPTRLRAPPHSHTRYPVYNRSTLPSPVGNERPGLNSMLSNPITSIVAQQIPSSTFRSVVTPPDPSAIASTLTSDVGIQTSLRVEKPSAEVFLTKGNTEETIPLGLGMDESIRDIIISPNMVRNGSEFNHVVLLCNASYPVDWIYEGVGAPMLYTTQIRTVGNFFNPQTYGYSSIVVLVQDRLDERQTGTYFCMGIERPQLRTGFHLYFKGEFGFPSLQNVIIQPPSRASTIILPCPTTDPAATIGLYKVASSKESRNITLHGSFAYDPRKGFSVTLSDMSNPFGTYICKFNDIESDWKIQIVKPKYEEVQAIPNGTVIKMDNLADHSFICKAKESIQLMLPNTVDFGRVEYTENFEDEFPFRAQLTITPSIPLFSVANYFKVNCQSRRTRRILHTWEYSNFGSEVINVGYDSHHKRLLCCTKSGLTPIHEMAKCETVTDCNIKKHCFQSGRCDYAFPPQFVDAPRGCTAVEFMDDFPSHIMRCSVGHFSQTMMVTSNIANNNLIIYDGGVPDTDEILKIVFINGQRNRIEVRCVASIFYFSTNIIFALEHKDGTLIFADETDVEDVNSYGPTLKTTLSPYTERILCFAPLIRSSQWRNVSLNIGTLNGSVTTLISKPSRIRRPRQFNSLVQEDDISGERTVTSVKASTSVITFLRKKQGHLIRVMQDI